MELALASRPISFSPFVLTGYDVLSSLPHEQPHNKEGFSTHDASRAPRTGEPNEGRMGRMNDLVIPLGCRYLKELVELVKRGIFHPLHKSTPLVLTCIAQTKISVICSQLTSYKRRKSTSYSESVVSVVDEILCLDPHIDHSKDQKQEHAPSPSPWLNQEALSPTGGRGYERTD